MFTSHRSERLAAELDVLKGLAEQSDIFEFEPSGDPPERYKITLHGKGICRVSVSRKDVEYGDRHELQLQLGYGYPERPPEVRWLTPIFHPNISAMGTVRLEECGLKWDQDMMLDVVCERLWDLVRGAYVNSENASNYSARNWYAEQSVVELPVDRRPIRGPGGTGGGNVVRYRRGGAAAGSASDDVLYIGEDTPAPPKPGPRRQSQSRSRKRRNDDDILYIGDD